MIIENKLTKKVYYRLILRDLMFESKRSLIMFVLYIFLWRTLWWITKVGQLKTNIPIFLGLSLLLLFMIIQIVYTSRKHLKNDFLYSLGSQIEIGQTQLTIFLENAKERYVFPWEDLVKVKENKKWYFLYFQNQTFIPISKGTEHSLEHLKEQLYAKKPIHRVYWIWSLSAFTLITIFGMYIVGANAVNYNGVLAWKIQEWKTDSKINLKNNNFYETRLAGIIDSVNEKMELEPYLMTNDLEIEFEKDGTITSIYTYIYGFGKNQELQTGYLVYFDSAKDKKVTVHKQDWNGQGTTAYDPQNDLTIVIDMLDSIPIEEEVQNWNEDKNAVLYKGIRNWGSDVNGIRFIDENGNINFPTGAIYDTTGPSVSLYIPGKEDLITPQRYVYKPR